MARCAANANCKLADIPSGKRFAAQRQDMEHAAEQGQVVMETLLTNYHNQIDISNYSSGIYLLQVNYPDGYGERVKIIKE